MKYLVCATLFVSCLSTAQQLAIDAISATKADKTLLTDIISTGNNLVAVGKHGTVITSADAKQWQQAKVPTQVLLTAVNFSDNKHGWACGHDATIINSADSGQTWSLQQSYPVLDKPCLDILFIDDVTGFAVGAYGMFYHTTDGGAHWQSRFLNTLLYPEDQEYLNDLKEHDPEGYAIETASILPHFNRIEKTNDGLVIVGEMGLMAISTDKGNTWQRMDEIYPGSFFSFAANDKQEIVAGLRGNIFTKSGIQQDWLHLVNDKTATINSILNHNNTWLLLGNSGVIFNVSNNKVTYDQQSDGKSILAAVVHDNKLIMATENGIKVKELTP
jgi:photosystem II stability/assembly factor-like uncharacterized protein